MPDTPEPFPPLSPATQTAVAGLVRAKRDVEQQTKNLQQALADDVAANPPRLTPEQAAVIAKTHEVKAPPKPGDAPEAVETSAEANQAQLDAQTKVAEEAAAKTAPKPPPHAEAHREPEPPPKPQAHADNNDRKPAPASTAPPPKK